MIYTLTKIASNPGLLTFELTNTKNEKLVFRPLLPTDNHKLADFLAGLSLQTRLFYTFESYDLRMAIELCEAIAKYDKLRFVIETSDNKIVGLFEFSFDLVQDDIDRYR